MKSVPVRPEDPFDAPYWTELGGAAGRRNDPRTPGALAADQTALQVTLNAASRAERMEFLEALDALTKRRLTVQRQLHAVHAQATNDPRQAVSVSMLMNKDRELAAERDRVCRLFLEAVESLKQDAGAADAAWRAENERHRDRRLTLDPTELAVPAEVLEIPADPFS